MLKTVFLNDDIIIHQTKHVKQLLKKFMLDEANEMKTLMQPTMSLGLDEELRKLDIIYR